MTERSGGAQGRDSGLVGAIRFGKPAGIDAVHTVLCCNPWFAELPQQVRQMLLTIGEQRDVKRGEFVWEQGGASDGLAVVLCGLLEDFVLAPNGRRSVTLIHGPGEWVGMVATILNRPQRTSVVALESMKLLFIPRARLDALLVQQPELYRPFIALIAQRIESAVASMRDRPLRGEQRLYHALIRLGASSGDGKECYLALSQRVLADVSGLTRPRVAELIAGLKADGLVRTTYSGLQVLDLPALRALAATSERNASDDSD